MKSILVTGGCGFIGSNFIHYIFGNTKYDGTVVCVDKLSYAGNLKNISEVVDNNNFYFYNIDVCNTFEILNIINTHAIDTIIHFAAETHVDRSIESADPFIQSNIVGTYSLLESIKLSKKEIRMHYISTDEVFGDLGPEGFFYETNQYKPRSPYSASKASGEMLVMAYYSTYGIPYTISNCCNNYGMRQYPEKLIPLMIRNMLAGKTLPIYGNGSNIREWIFVYDHCEALWGILNHGRIGESYNIGGTDELDNLSLVKLLCSVVSNVTGNPVENYLNLITFVDDRKGHDRRYALNCDKILSELGWKASTPLIDGLEKTVRWELCLVRKER